MKKINRFEKLVHTCFILGSLLLSNNLLAADNKSIAAPIKSTQLNDADRKVYGDVLDLINEYSGAGDNLTRAKALVADLAQRNPNSAYPYAAQANLELMNGNPTQAYALALKATKLNPNILEAYLVIADVKRAQNDIHSAQIAADKAIAIAPNNPSAMVMQAVVDKMLGKYEESETWFRKAIQNQNNIIRKSNIYYSLGTMLANKSPSDIPGATEAYSKSAELTYDKSPWRLNDISVFLYENTDHYDQAIEYCEQALKIMDFGNAHINIGLAEYYKWGDSMQNPQKYKNAKVKPLDPKAIFKKTGVTPEYAFLTNASVRGTPSAAIFLLKKRMIKDVDIVPDHLDGTALIQAAGANHLDLVRMLITKGANVNAEVKESKFTALHMAIANSNLEMIKFLIDKGARLNIVDASRTPLLEFTLRKPISILEYLLQHGADPSMPNSKGEILIASAVGIRDVDAVRLLVEKYHADVNAKTSGLPILVMAATADGKKGKEIVRILLKAGANPWVKYGADVMFSLTQTSNPVMFPSFKENADMIMEARKSYPKPADFNPQTIEKF